uniref:AlNc14C364G11037 protein n=1 Tax=Albugo laibachii Nc14 TaxID=890382 RepID=F0WXV0_9STRA|nr:AlNc14C364G11037 [Albugo laibachii Nc14]|eukprot:CCA26298.1 AlNc14C364G11037 [Albugo laibachii Nc14]
MVRYTDPVLSSLKFGSLSNTNSLVPIWMMRFVISRVKEPYKKRVFIELTLANISVNFVITAADDKFGLEGDERWNDMFIEIVELLHDLFFLLFEIRSLNPPIATILSIGNVLFDLLSYIYC